LKNRKKKQQRGIRIRTRKEEERKNKGDRGKFTCRTNVSSKGTRSGDIINATQQKWEVEEGQKMG